jgi:hypothetical protein
MSKFDDLFNDFMGEDSNKKRDDGADIMGNLFNKLSSLNNFDKNGLMNYLDYSLGEPDRFENFEKNGFYFQKQRSALASFAPPRIKELLIIKQKNNG